ncbi:O-antigen ligase family protein, partial [Candidatus Roizmanbacteria bacterium]|nr:O-antigen ligase family protein [Candidatus Roizmanbacteria bacterium]
MTEALQRIIRYSYYILFFLAPLILTPWNYELFEFNKMLTVYVLTTIVTSAWLIRMILEKRIIFRQTPLDIPFGIFLIVHLIATVNSIDPHISVWGYYGRFNGGLVSLIAYLILYYALVSNVDNRESKKTVLHMLLASLISGFFVAVYGIAQHFGIDAHIWVQDVQNRVFSTLGQPNWLAAYLTVLIPIAGALALYYRRADSKFSYGDYLFGAVCVVYYLTLLYTKSRSGFLAFWIVNILFWAGAWWLTYRHEAMERFYPYAVGVNSIFLVITLLIGSPFPQLNNLTQVFQKAETSSSVMQEQESSATESAINNEQSTIDQSATNITDSGEIRKLVWQAAWDATRARPYFGWGADTFAWIFYRFKPLAHNLTSEWDFLYNKAHNEYLN